MTYRQYATAESNGRVVAIVTEAVGGGISQSVTDLETGEPLDLDAPLLVYPHIRVPDAPPRKP